MFGLRQKITFGFGGLLLLSSSSGPNVHLQLLSKARRLLQSREFRRRLAKVKISADTMQLILDWEQSGGDAK